MSAILPIGPASRLAGPYTAAAGQTVFTFAFAVLDPGDVRVETAPASLPDLWTPAVLGTDYALPGAYPRTGGTVVFGTGRAAGTRVRIVGAAVIANTQDPLPAGRVDSGALNRFFDRSTIWAQEVRRDIGDEAASRLAGDTALGSRIASEATASAQRDTALGQRIDMVDGSAAIAASQAAIIAAGQASLYEGVWKDDGAAVLSDAVMSYLDGPGQVAAGNIVRTREEGFAYRVLPASASGPHIVQTMNGVKLGAIILDPRAFGADPTGEAPANDAFDRLIANINAMGTMGNGADVHIPAGRWNLTDWTPPRILVSNVHIQISPASIFTLRDGGVWKLGSAEEIVENIFIIGGQPRCENPAPGGDFSSPPAFECAWVDATHAARVFIRETRMLYVPHIFLGVTSHTLSVIRIDQCTGYGVASYNAIHIDNSANPLAGAAGLWITNCLFNPYPEAVPTVPALNPKAITGVSKANPCVITAVGHGYQTGARVRIALVGGAVEVNGGDFTITRLTADTFSLNGVDSTGWTDYTSGGRCVELHWAHKYETAVVYIKGHWDTVEINGGLYQHYPYLYSLHADGGTIGFVADKNVFFDYGAKSRAKIVVGTGFYGEIKIDGGWTFVLNEKLFTLVDNAEPGGFIADITSVGHVVGLTGEGIINPADCGNKLSHLNLADMRVVGVGRSRRGEVIMIRGGNGTNAGNVDLSLNNVHVKNPGAAYSQGDTWFRADIGVKTANNTRWAVQNCQMNAITTNYDLPLDGDQGTLQRLVRGNRCYAGAYPEYQVVRNAFFASGTTYTNHSGFIKDIYIHIGGAASIGAVVKDGATIYPSVTNNAMLTLGPGESFSVTYTQGSPGFPAFKEGFRD